MICPRCKQSGALSDRYDAVYCRTCDRWLESPCEDGSCWRAVRRDRRSLPPLYTHYNPASALRMATTIRATS